MCSPFTSASCIPVLAIILLAIVQAPGPDRANAEEGATLARRLNAAYHAIGTISCEIRKTVTAGDMTERWLSRVHYQAPNRIHVENVAPIKRRIVSDGTNLYYHVAGRARGFSAPLSALEDPMLSASRNIPGTPVEHLMRLEDCPEEVLPGTEELPVQRGYRTGDSMVVLSCDPEGRLVGIAFFKTPKREILVARYTYSSFQATGGGAWIPRRHLAELFLPGGEKITETRRIENLVLDKPVTASLFNPALFFQDVTFVNDFSKTGE